MPTTLPTRSPSRRLVTWAAAAAILLGGVASPLAAQRSASGRPAGADSSSVRATTTSAAPTSPSAVTAAAAADATGFREGSLYVGPRIWAGVYGTLAVGVQGEKAIGGQRKDLGNGRLGVGGSIDMYSYSDAAYGYRWSYRVIPVSGFVNYHFDLKESKFDPYAGVGLGYYIVSSSVDGPGASEASARGSALFLGLQLGARYFVKPNLAVQAQTGLGLGALSVGVTWKR